VLHQLDAADSLLTPGFLTLLRMPDGLGFDALPSGQLRV